MGYAGNMLTQEQYDTIRMYVSNGHALHPEHAHALLDAFETLLRAADKALEDPRNVALSMELYDDQGYRRLRLEGEDGAWFRPEKRESADGE